MPHRAFVKAFTNPYSMYLVLWACSVFLFAVAYFFLSYVPGHGITEVTATTDAWSRFLTALYFSTITGATVGYGDILPLGFSRALAALEGIVSFVLLAMFVSRVAARHQDIAIDDIHALSRDSLFNNFRHGLFIARKDLDAIVRKVDEEGALTERDWKNVRTAFRQMHMQVRHVPKLYATHQGATVDEDHEQLVLDSVERSLRRARETIELLESRGMSCRTEEKCMAELAALVHTAHHSFVTLFSTAYNAENNEAFAEMLVRLNELRVYV
ncbi:MAG: potassium channel family protein [Candidatus Pacebacteria bacterium]|nr:potassium channel family protein [Candidatus Paceibacterota bacterium]